MGIYITMKDPLRNHKIFARRGTALKETDFENDHILVNQGLAKQSDPCHFGLTLRGGTTNPTPYGFMGTIMYSLAGTLEPTGLPSIEPSFYPSTSFSPSVSGAPVDDSIGMPSQNPTISLTPTYSLVSLTTPSDPNPNDRGGSSADGVMFDLVAATPLEVYSFTFGQMASFPMNIRVYSRVGSHYYAYDDESRWDLIKSYTNYTSVNEDDPRQISFPPQSMRPGETRGFYIAIVETYGEERPLIQSLINGDNYLEGVWKADSRLSIMEGAKLYGITEDRPFGLGMKTE